MNYNTFSIKRILVAITLFICALVVILLMGNVKFWRNNQLNSDINNVQIVEAEKISYQDHYIYKRNYIGKVESQQTSEIGFEISGMLKEINYDDGHHVKKGEILASLDTQLLNARKKELQASLLKAQTDAKYAEITYNRIANAKKRNAVSDQQFDEALEAKEIANLTVAIANAGLEAILVEIQKAQLRAPFDGIIIERMLDKGTVVSAGLPVVKIQQIANYNIRVGVTTKIADSLRIGEEKSVVINDKNYKAVISAILPSRNETRTIEVILKLNQSDKSIRTGDIVLMPMDYTVYKNGFWLPLTSLKEGKRGLWSVYAVNKVSDAQNSKFYVDRRAIEVFYTNSDSAYVAGAILDAEKIVTSGAEKLVPRQQIKILANDE